MQVCHWTPLGPVAAVLGSHSKCLGIGFIFIIHSLPPFVLVSPASYCHLVAGGCINFVGYIGNNRPRGASCLAQGQRVCRE